MNIGDTVVCIYHGNEVGGHAVDGVMTVTKFKDDGERQALVEYKFVDDCVKGRVRHCWFLQEELEVV